MAAIKVFSFAVLSVALFLAVSSQQEDPALAEDDDCPPWAPWCPKWVECNYTAVQGRTCQDCSNQLICTKVGGLLRPCWYPNRPYCVEGRCVPEPSEECASTPQVPSTVEPPTVPPVDGPTRPGVPATN